MSQNHTPAENLAIVPLNDVRTVNVNQSVVDAAQLMQKHRVGCLVVVDAQGLVAGVLSERDILKWVAAASPTAFRQKVQDIMTKNVISVAPNTPLCDCRQLMLWNNIRHLPVVQNGKAVGMLSIRDVVTPANP